MTTMAMVPARCKAVSAFAQLGVHDHARRVTGVGNRDFNIKVSLYLYGAWGWATRFPSKIESARR